MNAWKHILIALALLGFAAATAAAEGTIRLRSEAMVRGGFVRLGEVAEVESVDATATEAVEALFLGRSPTPGAMRRIGREEVLAALRRGGFSVPPWEVDGADWVQVERGEAISSGQAGRHERLGRELEMLLEGQPYAAGAASVQVEVIATPRWPEELETSSVHWRLPRTWLWGGVLQLAGSAPDGDEVMAVVRVEGRGTVLRARRSIGRGRDVSARDFESVEEDLVGETPLGTCATLEGRRAARDISRGDVVQMEDLLGPILVYRRQEVRVISNFGGCRIETVAVALDEGGEGETIRVKGDREDGEFPVRVIGPGQVAPLGDREVTQ